MMNIDWELLRRQKAILIDMISKIQKATEGSACEYILIDKEDAEFLQGILHLLDSIQDDAVDKGFATEITEI